MENPVFAAVDNDQPGDECLVQRKHPASQNPAAIKKKKQKWKEAGNTKRGKLEFSFQTEEERRMLLEKVKKAKTKIGGAVGMVTTYNMLNQVLDHFLERSNSEEDHAQACEVVTSPDAPPSYQFLSEEECYNNDANSFICHQSAIDNLLSHVKYHDANCSAILKLIKTSKVSTCHKY